MSLFFPRLSLPQLSPDRLPEMSAQAVVRARKRLRVRSPAAPVGVIRSPYKGVGGELHAIREYVPGDDVRQMDWAAFARTGVPHVRVRLAERQPTFWLVVDTSASMRCGRLVPRSELALVAVRDMALLAKKSNGRLGAVVGDRLILPSAKRSQVDRIVAAISHAAGGDISQSIQTLLPRVRRWHEVIGVSDFVDPDLDAIARMAARCRWRSLAIVDEVDLPSTLGTLHLRCPETGRIVSVAASQVGRLRAAVESQQMDVRERLSRLGPYGITLESLWSVA